MDLDSKMIFEAYQQQNAKILTEAPIDMAGDITTEPITQKTLPGQGKAYGAGAISKIAAATNKSEEEIGTEMAKEILSHAKERKIVDGKEVYHFSGDPKTFINELVPVFKNKFGIPASQAGYTINYIMMYLLNAKKTAGGLKMDASKVKAARAAKATSAPAAPTSISGNTELEIHKDVAVGDKKIKQLVFSLFDEPATAKEWIAEIKLKKDQYNNEHEDDKISDLAPDILSSLITSGVLKPSKAAQAEKEGEGSGEVETIEDFPETDDVGTVARELGYSSRGRGFDPGGFSFND